MLRTLLCLVLLAAPLASADLAALSSQEVGKGLKEALAQGVGNAVGKLSAPDGFLGDPRVRIPLPPPLEKAEAMLRKIGLGEYADQLETTLNRAAEAAVTEARPILLNSLKKMTLADAKGILTGPDDSATQYFRKSSGETLKQKFLPKVKAATAKVKLAEDYDRFTTPAAQLGLIDRDDADLDALRGPQGRRRPVPADRRRGEGDPGRSPGPGQQAGAEGVQRPLIRVTPPASGRGWTRMVGGRGLGRTPPSSRSSGTGQRTQAVKE